ncbi:peptidoglycan DD-metalloendopeptidase family protein [Ekhidna sp.]|uniref:peptidoglycan DD-metalloendopeptidase family protein n=1 Tax=Ekhidna sp. TaxID=2608089 RepID=UPI003297398E
MNEVVVYLLKVIAIHGLLYLFYRLVLRNTGQHTFNRGYLILALLAAFFIPFIEISVPETTHLMDDEGSVIMWLSEPTSGIEEFELVPVQKETANTYWFLIPWFYLGIAMILLMRSIFYLVVLSRLKRHSEYVKKPWFKLFKISQDRPFSFFSNVFMPKSLFGTDAFEQILAHECEHVRRYHSIDRLLMDFVVSLFWFNPFIYLYRNALIEIHEFQADEVVLNRFKDPVGYQEILFSQLQSAQYSGLVSHFNFSMIKKRIVMMNKTQKMSGWLYLLALPVLFSIIFAFSGKEHSTSIEEVGTEIADMLGPVNTLSIPNLDFSVNKKTDQDSSEPSIMPVRSKDLVRLSSGFGMRMHPIYKVRKMHLGTDFACREGSEIIATADGVVEKVEAKTDGYGKLVVINHGNGFKTRYAQLSSFKIKQGDQVKKGDLIALSGNSGSSTAPHLHYEIQKGDKRVDPMDYITDFKPKPVIREIKVDDGKAEKKEKFEGQQMMTAELNIIERKLKMRLEGIEIERNRKLELKEMELQQAMADPGLSEKQKSQVKKGSIAEAQRIEDELLMKATEAREMAVKETEQVRFKYLAKEEAQVAQTEIIRANEALRRTTEEEKRAYQLQQEAEEKRQIEEKIRKEKLRFQDEKQDENGTRITLDGGNAGQNPLFVLDGEVVKNIENLSPDDIARINVLKGESAKKQYGEKGKDGVIEIFTKDKKKDKSKNKEKNKSKSKNKSL